MEIKDRISFILSKEKLTAALFADIIGVQRSSISHVLSGRNKPSLDYLQKILRSFPNYNAEWLVIGIGEPIKKDLNANPSLFDNPTSANKLNTDNPLHKVNTPLPQVNSIDENRINNPETLSNDQIDKVNNINAGSDKGKQIDKIVMFYTDGTFTSYIPNETSK